ncbi:MAG: pilus assembly protein PilM, partial [Methanocella sp.]
MFGARRRVIGLDLGGATVKLAHVGFGKGGPELLGAAVVGLPGGAFDESGVADAELVAGCIREAIAEAKVHGTRRVVAGIPGRHLTARLLTVPAMGHAELQEAVKWEAAAYLPYPVEEGYFDCLELGPGNGPGTLEVLALSARRSIVDKVSRAIQLADLDPIALDAVPLALGRVFLSKEAASDAKEATAIADVGAVNTEVSVFLRGQLRVSRSIPIGGAKFTAAVAEALDLGTDEADRLKLAEGIANQALASVAEEL